MKQVREYHVPVLLEECMSGLALKKDGVYLDGTMGGGGHYWRIADHLNESGIAVGLDQDAEAVTWVQERNDNHTCRKIITQAQFSDFDMVLKQNAIKSLDGALLDLGVSSHQLDDLQRGFAYKAPAPLDMRMNRNDTATAASLLAESSPETLTRLLADFGEVRNASRMADAILRFSRERTIATSDDLRECLEREYGSPIKFKVLSKVFQALRIGVNNELEELRLFLSKIGAFLNTGGRLVIIAYHSLEDRMVKNFLKESEKQCVCPPREPVCRCNKVPSFKRINRKVYHPSAGEIETNPRARSARLRIAERL